MLFTQDEIIKLAREAGIDEWETGSEGARTASQTRRFTRLKIFAALVAEATKDKAAKVCEKWAEHAEGGYVRAYKELSTAIRSMK